MKKTEVKKTVVKCLMGMALALLVTTAVPASVGGRGPATVHAAAGPAKPAAVKKVTKVKAAKTSITVKWTKSKKATGYQVRACKGKKLVKKTSTKNTKATVKGLKAGTAYTVKVRAYRKAGKKTAYSAWKSLKIRTAKAASKPAPKPEEPEGLTDKEIAATGRFDAPKTLEVGFESTAVNTFEWKGYDRSMKDSKIKWTVSDESKVSLTKRYSDSGNEAMLATPLKEGRVTITLTYAGHTVGSQDVTVYACPKSYTYWEMGCSRFKDRHALVVEYNEWVNTEAAKIMQEYETDHERATAAARYVASYMPYDASTVYEDFLPLWKEKKGGVCGHAAGILDCFLRKMQINTCLYYEDEWDHVSNWVKIGDQAYLLDATFTNPDWVESIGLWPTDEPKPDDGENLGPYPAE